MKYNLFTLIHNKTFALILFFIIIIQITSYISFIYPNSLFLSNKNIFIIHKFGISICNSELTSIIKNSTIFEDELTEEDLPKITYSYEYGLLITIIKDKIYIFDNEGSLLYKNNTKIITEEENPSYYTLVPIKNENDYYYYIIGFNDNNFLHFLYYRYNNFTKQNILIFTLKNFNKIVFITGSFNIISKSLTCQYMKNETYDEALTCFFIVNYPTTNTYYFTIALLDVFENQIVDREYTYYIFWIYNGEYIKYMKSSINIDHSRSLICSVWETGDVLCGFFIFNSNFISSYLNYKCLNNYNGMKINYFKEIEKSVLNCIDNDKKNIWLLFFNNTFVLENSLFYQNDLNSIYDYSFLYNKDKDEYYIISDLKIGSINNPLVKLYLEIRDNNTENEKQDKFEEEKSNEKEEERKEKEEEVEEKEEENENIIDCKELEKCKKCNNKSLIYNLCIKCNNEKGYFLLKNYLSNINGNYINCVNNITKPKNFYFNTKNMIMKNVMKHVILVIMEEIKIIIIAHHVNIIIFLNHIL